MATVSPNRGFLVARAVPTLLPKDAADDLTDKLEQLTVEDATKEDHLSKVANNVSPSDFVTLQSIRSSALARKTNTTSKVSRGGPALYTHLLYKDTTKEDAKDSNGDVKEKDIKEKKESGEETAEAKETADKNVDENKKKEGEAEEDGELLSRGPVRNVRPAPAHHPYSYGSIPYGTAATTTVHDFSAFSNYGSGYECGSTWSDSPETVGYISASSTPDTVLSSEGYVSSSPAQHSPHASSPYTDTNSTLSLQDSEITRLLDTSDLPDTLADFILAYSRQYTENKEMCNSRVRPPSADSGVDSPMSARSAPHQSPEVPTGGNSGPTTPTLSQTRLSPRKAEHAAKQKLHSMIRENELAEGFHWAVTCAQCAPGALKYQDADGDTVVHIVVAHMDLGKIYAVCEQMRKMEGDKKDFDQGNKYHETPLFVAVQQRSPEVVAYLLELGANPNVQTSRGDRDTALHYAASRGLTEILELLVNSRGIRLDDLNARGQSALVCAVKNHGVIDERTQTPIDNAMVISALLNAGADPCLAESTTGKTIVHFCVEKMDVKLLDLLKNHVDDDQFTELANMSDFNQETAVDLLESPAALEHSSDVRSDIYIRLLASGAFGNKSCRPLTTP